MRHAIDDIIAEADMHITNFMQPSSQEASGYVQALLTIVREYGADYDEYGLKRIFIEGLIQSIQESVCSYRA